MFVVLLNFNAGVLLVFLHCRVATFTSVKDLSISTPTGGNRHMSTMQSSAE